MNGTRGWQPPQFCDHGCPHAAFAAPEASGACRREQAVWCTLLKKHNNKNARCLLPPAAEPARRRTRNRDPKRR